MKYLVFIFLFLLILCEEDYYQILEIDKNASDKEIKKQYRKLALKVLNLYYKYHPDKNKDNQKEAEEKFIKINEAYEVLGNPEKRKIYDEVFFNIILLARI